jgi:small subunit ribosomal protein S21
MAKSVNLEVKISETRGDVNRLIKKFIKKTKKLGLIEEIRNRRYYEKPSISRRKKKLQRKRMARKAEQERRKQLNIE